MYRHLDRRQRLWKMNSGKEQEQQNRKKRRIDQNLTLRPVSHPLGEVEIEPGSPRRAPLR